MSAAMIPVYPSLTSSLINVDEPEPTTATGSEGTVTRRTISLQVAAVDWYQLTDDASRPIHVDSQCDRSSTQTKLTPRWGECSR